MIGKFSQNFEAIAQLQAELPLKNWMRVQDSFLQIE